MGDERRAIYDAGITPGLGYIAGPEGEKARRDALDNDEDISYRVVVNIVGKERQGKTSLRRFLAYEPFNPHEVSTVGIDHELVDTKGLTESWSPLSIKEANLNEYNLVLGKCVRQRLEISKERQSNAFYLAHIMCFTKIFGLFHLMMLVYYTLLYQEALQGLPWFGCMLIVFFALAGLVFGVKDGFGVAIGLYILLLKCDSIHRWELINHFREVKDFTFAIIPYAEAYAMYALLEVVIGIPSGSSFGKGMAFVLCLAVPPYDANVSQHPFSDPHVHIFAILVILCIATSKFRRIKYLFVLPIAAMLAVILPEEYSYTVFCSLGCGQSHVLCLRLGQNLYLAMNNSLKLYFPLRWQRRLLVDLVGIFPGILVAKIFGWEISLNFTYLHLGCGLLFMASIHILNAIMKDSKAESSPCGKRVTNASDVLVNRMRNPCIKLILKDFAGHPLYHSAHHIYMSGHSIYIVVFNLEEAKSSYDGTLAQVLYWLQSIYVHAQFPNVSVLLVATHRDSEYLRTDDRHTIGKKLREHIPNKFHQMLVWNDGDVPFFAVENSRRDDKDLDHVKLRATILDVAKNARFRKETWPVRYLSFFRIIETFRSQGKLIEEVRTLLEIARNSECGVQNLVQLEDLLLHFDSIGEIMYNVKDNRLKHLVIFDPRVLVNLIGSIVTIPSRHERDQDFFLDWAKLEESGLCSGKLLEHVIKDKAPDLHESVGYKRIARLLECYDLLCQIQLPVDIQRYMAIGEYYLIPACLPTNARFAQNFWETKDTDDVIYIDFGSINPTSIFLRLVCQCTAQHNVEVTPDDIYLLNVSQTSALFNFGRTHSYKFELEHAQVQSARVQELIKITIRTWDGSGCLPLLKLLNTRLVKIVRGNFEKCDYRLGVKCPCPDPHDYSEGHDVPILPLTSSRSDDRESIPIRKEFWCRGRKILVESGKATQCGEGSSAAVLYHRVDSHDLGSLHVLDLPETMYRHICVTLNMENILAKDWKGLAGVLQLSHRQVEQLSRRHDPCDALLKHWGVDPAATVDELTQKLTDIQRTDLVTFLEDANSYA